MNFNIQPILRNSELILRPLQEDDFDTLYTVASDPKIWEQHPNKNRWQEAIFRTFFEGAMQSKGAFVVIDRSSGDIIGSTRFYDYDEENNSIFIGYTFYAARFWGTGINHHVKALMLDYIFEFVSKVYFHIGAENFRSQTSIERLGAVKVAVQEVAYHGESPILNFQYRISKQEWLNHRD